MALIDKVREFCTQLCKQDANWIRLFRVHGLDIQSDDFEKEMHKELRINRDFPGFQDFSWEGVRAIEPGKPALSLLYHALASPNVLTAPAENGKGAAQLTVFPSLHDMEIIENYVFAARHVSVEDLLARVPDSPVAVAVFAYEYRPGSETVHRKHADLCFSRTGLARVGNEKERYEPRLRGFVPFGSTTDRMRVLPARYGAFVAVQLKGDRNTIGPMRFRSRNADEDDPELRKPDSDRLFWSPIHKLFSGPECIREYNLHVALNARHRNEKLRRIHLRFLSHKQDSGWREEELDQSPFVFEDEIADISESDKRYFEFGHGVVIPRPHELVAEAKQGDKLITFRVPNDSATFDASLRLEQRNGGRSCPEFVYARQSVVDNQKRNLNDEPNVDAVVQKGGYRALHYIDYTADGFVKASCPELSVDFPRSIPAYSLVTAPDFFCIVSQAELLEWTQRSLPSKFADTIWAFSPDTLADNRIPANLQFPGADFRSEDRTVTAIVSMPEVQAARETELIHSENARHAHLPDGAAGIFAPGWDVSADRLGKVDHLAAYGLGSPFLEDARLCAALSTFWPAVAPDSTRAFAPRSNQPTVVPLTDAEIGMTDAPSWDGVSGPRRASERVIKYADFAHADYVQNAIDHRISLEPTGHMTSAEYRRRVLTMARVYEALGIDHPEHDSDAQQSAARKAKWTVLSFRIIDNPHHDPECMQALRQTGTKEFSSSVYRFEIYRHGRPAPNLEEKPPTVSVRILEMYFVICDSAVILTRKVFPQNQQEWQLVDD